MNFIRFVRWLESNVLQLVFVWCVSLWENNFDMKAQIKDVWIWRKNDSKHSHGHSHERGWQTRVLTHIKHSFERRDERAQTIEHQNANSRLIVLRRFFRTVFSSSSLLFLFVSTFDGDDDFFRLPFGFLFCHFISLVMHARAVCRRRCVCCCVARKSKNRKIQNIRKIR